MLAALIAVSVLALMLVCLLVVQAVGIAAERQDWATERRQLVDRAIARHTGEILALDRQPRPKGDVDEVKLIEGLS